MNEYILLIYIHMLHLYIFFNSKKIKVRELVTNIENIWTTDR
jgi:hypothetical protein